MPGGRRAPSHNNDVCIDFAVQGFSKSVLARLFELDRSTIQKYLKGIPADGARGGAPIYKISRVAPILSKIGAGKGEESITDPNKMRPGDRKDHWQAVQAEQKAMEQAGDLWHTEKIIDLVSQAYKHIKLSVQLFEDTVERESELTERQRGIIQELTDNLLADMQERLIRDLVEQEVEEALGEV